MEIALARRQVEQTVLRWDYIALLVSPGIVPSATDRERSLAGCIVVRPTAACAGELSHLNT